MAPPGEILSDELEARGWTQKDLAEIMGRPEQAISEIINGKKQITPETAIELGQAFGTSAEFWINLETGYQLWLKQKGEKGLAIARKSRLYELAPIPELKRHEWIRDTKDINELENDVCALLDLASPSENPRCAANLRASYDRCPETTARVVWLKRAEHLVRSQNPGEFNLRDLRSTIPEILACAEDIGQLPRVPKILLNHGVRFVIVPHLKHTFLDGSVFFLDRKPVIALTLRFDRIDSFWFTLMHELAHLVLGHKGAYLDTIYGRTTEAVGEEADADRIAQDWLIDPVLFSTFVENNQPYFSKEKVLEFAREIHRHPGVIAGRLQKEYKNFRKFRQMLVKVRPVLEDWFDKSAA
jgi:HTH-type transcriptional regulator/antitoxin HigA